MFLKNRADPLKKLENEVDFYKSEKSISEKQKVFVKKELKCVFCQDKHRNHDCKEFQENRLKFRKTWTYLILSITRCMQKMWRKFTASC